MKLIKIMNFDALYDGELDKLGRPCGMGIARVFDGQVIDRFKLQRVFEGSFYKGKVHGICVESYGFGHGALINGHHSYTHKETFEWKSGKKHGLGTVVTYSTKAPLRIEYIHNRADGLNINITDFPDEAFYWKGKATKALKFVPNKKWLAFGSVQTINEI